jgi:SagB-type dehydrogenase family enzyme
MKQHLQDVLPPQSHAVSFDVDNTSEILHETTKWFRGSFKGHMRNIVRYLTHPDYIARAASGYNHFPNYAPIALPEPRVMDAQLAVALAQRRSSHNLGGAMEISELSDLLHYALRINRRSRSAAAPNVELCFRPYPSPGGLYPTEIYLFLNRVSGIAPCIVHYDARSHQLRVLAQQDGAAFAAVEIQGGGRCSDAPVVMVMTSVPQRVTAKYGPRGYRMALLEAGHASQSVCVVAEGLGLGSLVYGSYYDDELAEALQIDGVTETVATVILLGKDGK